MPNDPKALLAFIQKMREERQLGPRAVFDRAVENRSPVERAFAGFSFFDSLVVDAWYRLTSEFKEKTEFFHTIPEDRVLELESFCTPFNDESFAKYSKKYVQYFWGESKCDNFDYTACTRNGLALKMRDTFLLLEKKKIPNLFEPKGNFYFMLKIAATNGYSGWILFKTNFQLDLSASFFHEEQEKRRFVALPRLTGYGDEDEQESTET